MKLRIGVLAACVLGLSALGSAALAQSEPIRKGEGAQRATLNADELKPFKMDAWSKLSDWKNGNAITAADMDGKVVVITMWRDVHPASKRAFDRARKLAEKYGKQGVIFVSAHNPDGWAEADKPAPPAGVDFRLAYDAKGEFRKALHSVGDPDVFLIDRAGQTRYASITTESVENGIQILAAETKEAAAGLNDRLASDKKSKDIEDRKTLAIRDQLDLTNLPEIAFDAPPASAYEKVKWPKLPRDPNKRDENVEVVPKTITLPDTDWFPKRPEIKGRMMILYFWSPYVPNTYQNSMPFLDRLQRQYGRDAVIIGVLTDFDQINGIKLKPDEKDPENMRKKMKQIGSARQLEHYLVMDPGNSILHSITSEAEVPLPFVAIVSSDLTARWWSTAIATDPEAALLKILENDPGIQARKKAEEAYIKSRSGKPGGG